jgi:hypothetical protein
MIPDTLIEVNTTGVYLNGEKIPNFADFQQQATELYHHPMFEMMLNDAKTRAYKDGFLESRSWETTLGAKGWYACAENMKKLLKEIIDYRGDMV